MKFLRKRAYMDDAIFEDIFDVYTNDQIRSRYILDSSIVVNFIKIREILISSVGMIFLKIKFFIYFYC
ncbi:DUF3137 domain-containing protein [Campylobacter sputorum]|uniref:DUF3137 domain-containing protein n=1 Tax=Campylobacter sputorum TaxID=206 RepID=UPI0018965CA0|nr:MULTISPECIES: DUF3137 domain-containing protein [Campylobacter]MBF6676638.1 DUF3137 domain-containing protein [Campylobacter sp. RM12321]